MMIFSYWVIKVPVLTQENPTILDQIKEEMPFFLSFLQHRKLCHQAGKQDVVSSEIITH